jgi:hypothetical protein
MAIVGLSICVEGKRNDREQSVAGQNLEYKTAEAPDVDGVVEFAS